MTDYRELRKVVRGCPRWSDVYRIRKLILRSSGDESCAPPSCNVGSNICYLPARHCSKIDQLARRELEDRFEMYLPSLLYHILGVGCAKTKVNSAAARSPFVQASTGLRVESIVIISSQDVACSLIFLTLSALDLKAQGNQSWNDMNKVTIVGSHERIDPFALHQTRACNIFSLV